MDAHTRTRRGSRQRHTLSCIAEQRQSEKPRVPIDARFILKPATKGGILKRGTLPHRGRQELQCLDAIVDCRCPKLEEALRLEITRADNSKKRYQIQRLADMVRRPTFEELMQSIMLQKGATLRPADVLSFMVGAHPELGGRIRYEQEEEVCALVEHKDGTTAVLIRYVTERNKWLITCPDTACVQLSTTATIFVRR